MQNNISELIIEANRPPKEYFKDLWRHRELLYFFAWRDILVRYKQAFFGIAWALFRPLITMLLFTFIFGKLANFSSEGIAYPLFALSGMVPWLLFSSCLTETSTSLLNNPNLISKVYFPRMIIPTAQVMVQGMDFVVTLILLFIMIPVMGSFNLPTLIFLPLFILQTLVLCAGTGLFLSALTVKYRDVRYVIPFLVQFGMYVSPVGYGSFMIPSKWAFVYFLNPMAGIIEGFRWALFGLYPPFLFEGVLISLIVTMSLLYLGISYFRKVERTFGDII